VILSGLLVPIIPIFASLSSVSNLSQLRQRVCQVLLATYGTTTLINALLCPLAQPIVALAFEREAFTAAASTSVADIFTLYIMGSTAYISRDILVKVLYVLGDALTPLRVSLIAIMANALLDYLLSNKLLFGASGLVMSTIIVNTLSSCLLVFKLSEMVRAFACV